MRVQPPPVRGGGRPGGLHCGEQRVFRISIHAPLAGCDIIQMAEYVGSGEYGKRGKEYNPNVGRYDYFEAPVTINGKGYIVSFDVASCADVNNYRTHRLVDIAITPQGPSNQIHQAGLSSAGSAGTPAVSNITQGETAVNSESQNAAQGAAGAGGITTGAQAVQGEGGALNAPQGVQAELAGQSPRQTTLDIYQNRGTRQETSRAMQTTLDALSADKPVPIETVQAIPEVQAAYSHPVADDTSEIDTPERQQLRSQIADELSSRGSAIIDEKGNVEYTGVVEQGRQMDIVIGLPAAGKSAAVADPLSQRHHAIVVDSDEAKTRLPEYDNGYGAGAVHEESKAINAEILDRATERGDNIVLPIVGGSYTSVMKYISLARENGYTVRLYLNELSSNKTIGRALQRFLGTGRFIRPEILYSYGNRPTEVFNQIISQEGLVDGYEHYSNDVPKGERPRLIRSSDSGRYNTGGVERDSGADNIPVGDSRGETTSEKIGGNDNLSRSGSADRAAESQRGEVSAEAEDGGLYGRSVGAATPRRGEQVSKHVSTLVNANITTNEMAAALMEDARKGAFSAQPYTDAEAAAKVREHIPRTPQGVRRKAGKERK